MMTFVTIVKLVVIAAILGLLIGYAINLYIHLRKEVPEAVDDPLWRHRMMMHEKMLEDRDDVTRHRFHGEAEKSVKKAY